MTDTFLNDIVSDYAQKITEQRLDTIAKEALKQTSKRVIISEVKKFKKSLDKDFKIIAEKFAKDWKEKKDILDKKEQITLDLQRTLAVSVTTALDTSTHDFETELKNELLIQLRSKFHQRYNDMVGEIAKDMGTNLLKIQIQNTEWDVGIITSAFSPSKDDDFISLVDEFLDTKASDIFSSVKSGKKPSGDKENQPLFSIVVEHVHDMLIYLLDAIKDFVEHSVEYLSDNYDSKIAEFIGEKLFSETFKKSVQTDIDILKMIKQEMGMPKNQGRSI